MSTQTILRRAAMPKRRFTGALYAGNARAVVARGLTATKSTSWYVVASGFVEPVIYLLSMGIGLGTILGDIDVNGTALPYAAYIAPALLATSAMNGAIYDSTNNVFFKLNYGKLYEGMLSTSLGPLDVALGEIVLALLRGAVYAVGFTAIMAAMGLLLSPWALLAVPAAVLIAFGFASCGMAITSYIKTFQGLDTINFIMLPMFMFSATFFPISVYPQFLQWIIQALPLWHGVELMRGLTTGMVDASLLWHVLYYAVLIAIGLTVTTRRLRALFLR